MKKHFDILMRGLPAVILGLAISVVIILSIVLVVEYPLPVILFYVLVMSYIYGLQS